MIGGQQTTNAAGGVVGWGSVGRSQTGLVLCRQLDMTFLLPAGNHFPAPECDLLLDPIFSPQGWIDLLHMQDIALHVHGLALVRKVEAALVSAIGAKTELAVGA